MTSLVFCSKCGKTEQPGEEFTNKDGSTIYKELKSIFLILDNNLFLCCITSTLNNCVSDSFKLEYS